MNDFEKLMELLKEENKELPIIRDKIVIYVNSNGEIESYKIERG